MARKCTAAPSERKTGWGSALLRPGFESASRGNLDQLLTDFGLSPHPSLLLVVEGPGEADLLPHVMRMFGVRTDRDFIAIENMEGVHRDLDSLVAYAVGPQTEVSDHGRYLEPMRPLTRILVVSQRGCRCALESRKPQEVRGETLQGRAGGRTLASSRKEDPPSRASEDGDEDPDRTGPGQSHRHRARATTCATS